MHNQSIGKKGERLAADYLTGKGFEILERNWRWGRYEIDLIACYAETLHFIEVKTRTSNKFGYPEESVTEKKWEKLFQAAEAFLVLNQNWEKVQYDVLAIQFSKNNEPEIIFLEDFTI